MIRDIRYTQEVEPIIRAYDKIFDLLTKVWQAHGHTETFEANSNLEKEFPNWMEISLNYETLDFKRLQSTILPKELRYLVPRKKETSKLILDRRAITGTRF